MNKEIQKKSDGFSEESIRVIRNLIDPSKKLSDEQLSLFLHVAKERNLDPRLKQIYAVVRGKDLTIQTSIDGFRIIAERTGKYTPGKDTKFLFDDNKKLIGATVYVKKCTFDGVWHEVSATAYLHEYKASTPLWAKMPSVMIEKCAEARALRRAFPEAFSGLYSDDEMDQSNVIEVKDEIISEKEAVELEKIIEHDKKYKSCVLNFLKKEFDLDTLIGMPRATYDKILPIALKKKQSLEISYGEQQQMVSGG